jgi:long-chain acyl-CoA synthetase
MTTFSKYGSAAQLMGSNRLPVPDLLLSAAQRNPESICVCGRSLDDGAVTYAGMANLVGRFTQQLAALGVKSGSHVSIMLPRSLAYVVAYFAALARGAVVVPLGPELTEREVAADIAYCDVEFAICNSRTAIRHPQGIATLCADTVPVDGSLGSPANSDGFSILEESISSIDCSAPALMLHTSGSISRPKRVVLSHANLTSNALAHAASIDARDRDRVLIALPMHFGYCNTAQLLAHIGTGGTLVFAPEGFSPAAFCRSVERYAVTTTTLVPAMMYAIDSHDDLQSHNLSSLRCITFGGGHTNPGLLRRLAARLPDVDFIQTYGQTEAGPRVTTRRRSEKKPHSVGLPIPGVRISIRDNGDRELDCGQEGEVCVRSPGVMLGYYKRPEETAAVLSDGWLHTGDLGYISPEGELELVGRLRNMIIRAGVNIYVEQIEEFLIGHPAIAEVAVTSEPHELQGEVPVALLVPSSRGPVDDGELLSFCRTGLASYKIPIRFEWVSALPRTYNGKIARSDLGKSRVAERQRALSS